MTFPTRTLLDQKLAMLDENILLMSSLVDTAIGKAMEALSERDMNKAVLVVDGDQEINELRYTVEDEALLILATQAPAAKDLRKVIAAIHIAVELERIGDHAAGIANLVKRLEVEEDIDSLHKLPKMANRARKMLHKVTDAYVNQDNHTATSVIAKDEKLDRHYRRLFRETLAEMQDEAYVRRATFLLWIGHDLERIGDRVTNIAERIIFMTTGVHIEVMSDIDLDELG